MRHRYMSYIYHRLVAELGEAILMNLVVILLDTVRKDKLSVYNDGIDFTPNIADFVAGETVFTEAISQAPWTLPSHASMFTGLYPWEHEATQKQLYLDTDRELLAERFETAGYSTACFTSNTWISPYTGMTAGFETMDNFFDALPNGRATAGIERAWKLLNRGPAKVLLENVMDIGEYFHRNMDHTSSTPKVVEKSKRFIEANRDDEFFLFMNLMDAHIPHHPDNEYLEKHAPGVDPNEVCQRAYDHNSGVETTDYGALEALYDADIDYMDDQLGRLFEFFERQGLKDDTAFVIASDHGENLGEEDMMGHQFSVSEELVSVPLMIAAPGMDDTTVDGQFELRDLYDLLPSLVFDGESMIPSREYALGGYEYPKLDLRNVPEEHTNGLEHQLRFVRNADKGKKLVSEGGKHRMIDLFDREEIDVEPEYERRIDAIGDASTGRMLEDQDEAMKKRLEDLGYLS